MQGGGEGSAQTFAVLAGMSETGPHALPKDLAFEGSEDSPTRAEPAICDSSSEVCRVFCEFGSIAI